MTYILKRRKKYIAETAKKLTIKGISYYVLIARLIVYSKIL